MLQENTLPIFNTDLQSLKGEVWQPVHGMGQVAAISNFGRVKRLARAVVCTTGTMREYKERILRPTVSSRYVYSTGRYHFQLVATVSANNVSNTFYPHRMVYYLFNRAFPIDDPEYVIRFRNHNELDIRPENMLLQHFHNLKGKRLSTLRKFSASEKARLIGKVEFNKPVVLRKKSISCYNSDGNLVKSFKDCDSAQTETGFSEEDILNAICKPISRLGNFFWRCGKKRRIDVSIHVLWEKQEYNKVNGRKITQFDLNGIPVNFYDSIEEAELVTGISGKEIIEHLSRHSLHAGYYIWRDGHCFSKIEGI